MIFLTASNKEVMKNLLRFLNLWRDEYGFDCVCEKRGLEPSMCLFVVIKYVTEFIEEAFKPVYWVSATPLYMYPQSLPLPLQGKGRNIIE